MPILASTVDLQTLRGQARHVTETVEVQQPFSGKPSKCIAEPDTRISGFRRIVNKKRRKGGCGLPSCSDFQVTPRTAPPEIPLLECR